MWEMKCFHEEGKNMKEKIPQCSYYKYLNVTFHNKNKHLLGEKMFSFLSLHFLP